MLFLLQHRCALRLIFVLVAANAFCRFAVAAEPPFPILPGLEDAVEFWQRVFTRFGASDVVFFDPLDPGKVYSVLRVPDNDAAQSIIAREQARIIADYELNEDGRVRSQRGAREQFISGLKISGRYLPQMQKIFREEGLPPELAYLPLVESSFNVRARSSAGAVGMWQFTSDTGKKFLRITEAVDERRDPLISTRAAARLLKENYRLLGNWPLAITAYNHGTDGIFRGIEAVGSRNLMDLIQRFESPAFGFASKNFYAEFLAALEVATNSDAHFPFLRTQRPLVLREVEIKRRLPVQSLLKPTAISQNDFFDWNPALDSTSKYLPIGYRVKLPPEKVGSFVAAERIANPTPPAKRSARRAVTAQMHHRAASSAQATKSLKIAKSARQVKATSAPSNRRPLEKAVAFNTER